HDARDLGGVDSTAAAVSGGGHGADGSGLRRVRRGLELRATRKGRATTMRRATLALMAVLAAAPAARAQNVDIRLSDPALSILRDYTLRTEESARDVLVIAGDATIAGHVEGDVVVIVGKAQLASTAAIDGSLVVVSGSSVIAEGARVGGDVVTIGNLDAPSSFS